MSQISTTKDSTTQTVVSSVAYQPFGPTKGFTFGNGQTHSRGFDQDGRISSYTLSAQSIAVAYDEASRLTCLSTGNCTSPTNSYGYDNVDRLTTFTGPSVSQAFTYDGVGNRLTKTVGGNTDTYALATTSNRLASITPPGGGSARTFSYDLNGSTTNDAINQFVYNTRGRMSQAISIAGTTNYMVNSLGQRIRKMSPMEDIVYHYDMQGRLIAERNPSGVALTEYIYLGDIPVAVIR